MANWTKGKGYAILVGLLVLINMMNCKDIIENDETERQIESEIDSLNDVNKHPGLYKFRKIIEIVTGVKVREFSGNETALGQNSLWQVLYDQCGKKPTLACIKDNIFVYLDRSLGLDGDFELTDNVIFTRNNYIENKYDQSLNEIPEIEKTHDGKMVIPLSGWSTPAKPENGRAFAESESENDYKKPDRSTFEGITDTLYGKALSFIKGHDLKMQLPSLFGSATLRVSPKALEGEGGALVKLEMNAVEGRLFKGKIKKKLIMAFMALILVIKMIKLKLFFFLPMMIGAGAAKQVLLKVILFLFPAFAHLFKICHYYQGMHGHGGSKYHHHHHKIAHHHHHIRVPVPVPVHAAPHVEYPSVDHYPGGHGGHGYGEDHQFTSDLGPEYVQAHHRNDHLSQHALKNENELASWGLGANSYNKGSYGPSYNSYMDDQRLTRSVVAVTESSNYYPQSQPVYSHPAQAVSTPVRYAQQHQNALHNTQLKTSANNIRLQVLTPTPHPGATTVHVAYDAFYSPILQKMDNVFAQLGFNEEACRERLICSMYKNPPRYSPHSNLISAELSRDPQELQKPSVTNSAVARFHRYVEAARKGQDRGDCTRAFPTCTVNTEK